METKVDFEIVGFNKSSELELFNECKKEILNKIKLNKKYTIFDLHSDSFLDNWIEVISTDEKIFKFLKEFELYQRRICNEDSKPHIQKANEYVKMFYREIAELNRLERKLTEKEISCNTVFFQPIFSFSKNENNEYVIKKHSSSKNEYANLFNGLEEKDINNKEEVLKAYEWYKKVNVKNREDLKKIISKQKRKIFLQKIIRTGKIYDDIQRLELEIDGINRDIENEKVLCRKKNAIESLTPEQIDLIKRYISKSKECMKLAELNNQEAQLVGSNLGSSRITSRRKKSADKEKLSRAFVRMILEGKANAEIIEYIFNRLDERSMHVSKTLPKKQNLKHDLSYYKLIASWLYEEFYFQEKDYKDSALRSGDDLSV